MGTKVITAPRPAWRGMRIDYLTAVLDAMELSASPAMRSMDAVAVTEVEKGSPTWHAGLRPGMLVSHVEGAAVRTPKQFREAVAARAGAVQLRATDEKAESAARPIIVPGA